MTAVWEEVDDAEDEEEDEEPSPKRRPLERRNGMLISRSMLEGRTAVATDPTPYERRWWYIAD